MKGRSHQIKEAIRHIDLYLYSGAFKDKYSYIEINYF